MATPENRQRLLILDDDKDIGATMLHIAETVGFEVRFTSEPMVFFHWSEEWMPSHIAIDLIMPEMDGVQVLEQLSKSGCPANIIITSGVGNRILDAAARSAEEHGLRIIGVLAKPFRASVMRDMLSTDAGAAYYPRDTAASLLTADRPASDYSAIDTAGLMRAIETDEISIAYQPKIKCSTGSLAGFEALARWHHPVQGMISPEAFIPFAEQNGLIDVLTRRVVLEVISWFGQHGSFKALDIAPSNQAFASRDTSISVNVSALTLKNTELIEEIFVACDSAGIDPSRLTFELTETSAMDNPIASLNLLTRLRMKGFELSLDDFGTGYSSMLQLARLPFSELKVDKSFVMTQSRSAESRAVIKSIVSLGNSLGLTTTAEGVQSASDIDYLNSVGCTLAQGYYIARPMPKEELLAWISKRY